MSPEGDIYNLQGEFIGRGNTDALEELSQNDNSDKPETDGVEE